MNIKNAILCVFVASITFTSCGKSESIYPIYEMVNVSYVPDSLKVKHREYVVELVRAASNQMSGGDYEDVDQTIIQAKRTADEIFSVQIVGLSKKINDQYYNDIYLKPSDLSKDEIKILDSLSLVK